MLLNETSLYSLPLVSCDDTKYIYVGSVVNKTSTHLDSLIIHRHSIWDIFEYRVPTSLVRGIIPQVGTQLTIPSSKVEELSIEATWPKYRYIDFTADDSTRNFWEIYDNPQSTDFYSTQSLCALKVMALDDHLGQVQDLFFHPLTFDVHFLALGIRKGLSRKWVFVPTSAIAKIDWVSRTCYMDLMARDVLAGPYYPTHTQMTDSLEDCLKNQYQHTQFPEARSG